MTAIVSTIKYSGNLNELKMVMEPIHALLVEGNNKFPDFLNGDGYCSMFVEHPTINNREFDKLPELSTCIDIAKSNIKEYLVENGKDTTFTITAVWTNCHKPESNVRNHKHTHYLDTYSYVLFYESKENAGTVYIDFPDKGITQFTPEEGDILIFPAKYEHWTDTNKSGHDQLIIGIDFIIGTDVQVL